MKPRLRLHENGLPRGRPRARPPVANRVEQTLSPVGERRQVAENRQGNTNNDHHSHDGKDDPLHNAGDLFQHSSELRTRSRAAVGVTAILGLALLILVGLATASIGLVLVAFGLSLIPLAFTGPLLLATGLVPLLP